MNSAHNNNNGAYEVHHTVITVIEGVASRKDAEALARRILENGPVERLSITEGADVFRVEIDAASLALEADRL
jgi:hypothetical protein